MSMQSPCLSTLALTFLRLGSLGFGGPQAHQALLRSEIVERLEWVEAQTFEEGLVLCEALPGPSSSQLAILLGWQCRGLIGGLVSGLCFLLPGLLTVLVLSELWRRGRGVDWTSDLSVVIQPVIAAMIWNFSWRLSEGLQQAWQRLSSVLVLAAILITQHLGHQVPIALLLVTCGLARLPRSSQLAWMPWWLLPLGAAAPPLGAQFQLLGDLAWLFFKAGLLVFGGGLVIIPLMEYAVIENGWLSSGAFLDGVAIGQLSPGPVVLTSAFVGYQAGWNLGSTAFAITAALVATAAVFAPSFLLILMGAPVLERWRRHENVQRVLEGVRGAIPGAVTAAALSLTIGSLEPISTSDGIAQWTLLLGCVAALRLWNIKPEWLLLSGLLIGVGRSAVRMAF
jgi:chromate transporter